ncbi:MAG TPA: phosphoglucosamine mutase [Acidimicrobiia bacterium]|nr:phosphoglucosamine mutase [Acidimicrobiia bacterium]
MTLRFGTDGVRGVANRDLTPELVTALGRVAARVLGARQWIVGRDTRRSGPLLEAALVAGLCAEGADVVSVGVLPTPGVAYLSQADGAPAAMISASHNPFPDNGIKLFAPGGRKIPDDTERRIEHLLAALTAEGDGDGLDRGPDRHAADGEDVGVWRRADDASQRYVDHLTGALDGRTLERLHVVVDCGNGAASTVAPAALRALGARVTALNDTPDGTNINAACGSTDPSALQRAVVAEHADAGLAFDGDADRVIAIDERGTIVDGDQVLAILALDLAQQGGLRHGALAATVMSNLGLRRALREQGIELVETAVGDRNVLVAMEEHDLALGGEQSGHVILADHATTGDGTLTGIVLLDVARRAARPLSELAAVMTRLPQVLRNVRVSDKSILDGAAATAVRDAIGDVERELGGDGRVLVRVSGTEPVVRVMVEATTEARARQCADRLVDAVTGLDRGSLRGI